MCVIDKIDFFVDKLWKGAVISASQRINVCVGQKQTINSNYIVFWYTNLVIWYI